MPSLLILAHGQPSDPGPAAAEVEELAARVHAHLPGWRVGAATLAEPGALARAGDLLEPGLVFPLFMAEGWFTKTAIPDRMAEAGLEGWRHLAPLGVALAVQELGVRLVQETRAAEVLVAAHGSFRSAAPAGVAAQVAERIRQGTRATRVECAFIDQEPRLADVRGFGAGAVCLPFFAMAGEHVTRDLPDALATAGFAGRILPALGLHQSIPALIAALVKAGAED